MALPLQAGRRQRVPLYLRFISISSAVKGMKGSGLGGPVRVSESLSCPGRAQVLTFGGSQPGCRPVGPASTVGGELWGWLGGSGAPATPCLESIGDPKTHNVPRKCPAHRSREATVHGQKSNSSKQQIGQSELLSWFPLMFQFQSLGPPNSGFSFSLNVAEDRKAREGERVPKHGDRVERAF